MGEVEASSTGSNTEIKLNSGAEGNSAQSYSAYNCWEWELKVPDGSMPIVNFQTFDVQCWDSIQVGNERSLIYGSTMLN